MRSVHVGVKKKQLEDNPTKKTTPCHQNTKGGGHVIEVRARGGEEKTT